MSLIYFSVPEARKLALYQQGLLSAKPKFGKGKKGVLKAIQQLGYVQIDAISVIQRAHHHTLWSRVPGYKAKFLKALLSQDRSIFEYWSHAASFLPMSDYRFALPVMQHITDKGKHWYQIEKPLKDYVLSRIISEGPLYARDFETPKTEKGIMWNWKPAKKALHELFMEGKVMVKSRDGFQRLYDISERLIPPWIDTAPPTHDEYMWHCIEKIIKAHGLATAAEIRYQRIFSKDQIISFLKKKTADGQLIPVKVGDSNKQYYSIPEVTSGFPARVYKQVHFLSPFDNAVIQRRRLKELFEFDYQTEIYYPQHKRVYGYFSMPILYGTEFIGRLDPKAFREKKVLEIRNLVLEPTVTITDSLVVKLKEKLKEFAGFNECLKITIKRSQPASLRSTLNGGNG